jgi:hypothetical protein
VSDFLSGLLVARGLPDDSISLPAKTRVPRSGLQAPRYRLALIPST